MFRRYWLPVFAVVGLALAANAYAQGVTKPASGQASTAEAQTAPKAQTQPAIPPALQDSLNRMGSALEAANRKGESDQEKNAASENLNAQRAMASAAGKMFWVGVVEAVITFAGVMLVLGTLIYTKRAAEAARDAVVEAQKATVQSERHAKQQLRAYLVVDGQKVGQWKEKGHLRANIRIHNAGQTPAVNIRVIEDVRLRERGTLRSDITGEASISIEGDLTLGPGRDRVVTLKSAAVAEVSPDDAKARDLAVTAFGIVIYNDVFGEEHVTRFTHNHVPPYFEADQPRYARWGNSAD